MSVKIKVSYQEREELEQIIRRLRPMVKICKIPKQQQGAYKKAYIVLKE